MSKEQEQSLRDFYFSLAETIAMYEDCERLCPTDTLMEMCETLAGIMAEQGAIISTLENTKSEMEWKKVRDEFRRPLSGERFYSMHMDALCDMMRLAKHMKDVSKAKDELLAAMKRLERYDELAPLNVKLISKTLEAIPKVKTLKSDN